MIIPKPPVIITRQQAINERLHSYFTGVPCKRGHFAKRYTQSGVCYECLHPKFENPLRKFREQYFELHQASVKKRAERKEALAHLVTRKFRVLDAELDTFRIVLRGLAMMHYRDVTAEDLEAHGKVLQGVGVAVIPVRIFPEMEPYLRQMEPKQAISFEAPGAPATPAEYWPEHDPR